MKYSNKLIQKSLDELNRLTGLSLGLDCEPDGKDENTDYLIDQLQSLIQAYKEKNNQTNIMKRWILGDMDSQELSHTAKRLHIDLKKGRVVLLIESKKEIDESVLSILSNSFPDRKIIWLVPIQCNQIAMIINLDKKHSEKNLHSLAYLIMDILNTEAMLHVKISYSSTIEHLQDLSQAYMQASLAMKVCSIFYPEQNIYPHNKLGVARLIYGLSKEQCISYILEVIGPNYEKILQEETAHTFNCFFEHNLNIAETARQLHMHRNTFIYRLEQIEKLTGLDVRQFHAAMTFKTALLVMNYLITLP